MEFSRSAMALVLTGTLGLGLGACAPPGATATAADDTSPVTVGVLASLTGPFNGQAQQCVEGVKAGLDYATKGSLKIKGHPVQVEVEDDAFNVAKIAGGVTNLVTKGAKLIIACDGSDQSVTASEIAAQNKLLLITGPAVSSVFTGKNKYTFRASAQTTQIVNGMAVAAGDVNGQKVGVFSLNSAAGQTFAKDASTIITPGKATVEPVLVPAAATDITPYSQQVLSASTSTILLQWYGANTPQMWSSLDQQGVLDARKVFTTLDYTPTHALMASAVGKAKVVSHFFKGVTDNEPTKTFTDYLKKIGSKSPEADIYGCDGWNAGAMAAHALESSTSTVDDMISGLEGWKFESPMGASEIRAQDHAFLQPIYVGDLVSVNGVPTPKLSSVLAADKVAPQVVPMGVK